MGRALIKSLGTTSGGTTSVGITVAATGATSSTVQGITNPPGEVVTGTLEDKQSGQVYDFVQPFGAELGIQVGTKVKYDTVSANGKTIAVSLRLIHRGEIVSVNSTNNGGTLTDKATGQTIPFAQPHASEFGIQVGTKVNFIRVVNPNTGEITAVSLETKDN